MRPGRSEKRGRKGREKERGSFPRRERAAARNEGKEVRFLEWRGSRRNHQSQSFLGDFTSLQKKKHTRRSLNFFGRVEIVFNSIF